jgi:hypothetical protein
MDRYILELALRRVMAKVHRVCRTCGSELELVGIIFRRASQFCKPEAMELVGVLPDIRIKRHLIRSHSNTGALSEVYVVRESKRSFCSDLANEC